MNLANKTLSDELGGKITLADRKISIVSFQG